MYFVKFNLFKNVLRLFFSCPRTPPFQKSWICPDCYKVSDQGTSLIIADS